jgi:hypothetical protein
MYLYLKHDDSKGLLPSKPSYFQVVIPDKYKFSGEIGLCELHIEFTREPECFDICCDLCDTSVVGSQALPILRRIHGSSSEEHLIFDPIYYVPVKQDSSNMITVYLRPVQGHSSSVDLKSLSCTLHIKP